MLSHSETIAFFSANVETFLLTLLLSCFVSLLNLPSFSTTLIVGKHKDLLFLDFPEMLTLSIITSPFPAEHF